MGEDIEQRLAEATERVRELELTSSLAMGLEQQQRAIEDHIAELKNAQSWEERDVERLESLSLTRLIASLRGERDVHLARERAEAEAARYRVAEAQARLDSIRRECDVARVKLDSLASAPGAYEAALAAKERYLAESNDPRGPELMALAEERGRLNAERMELTEALDAARSARHALAELDRILGSASGWSTYDTFFGGGAIASMIKHSRLDQAARQAAAADQCLALLRTELADVGGIGPTEVALPVARSTQFIDVWFDNIFTDFMVGSRIGQARANVARCAGDVDTLGRSLHEGIMRIEGRLAGIESERRRLLTAE